MDATEKTLSVLDALDGARSRLGEPAHFPAVGVV